MHLIKHGFTPEQIEEKSLEENNFIELQNFHMLVRVKDDKDRLLRCEEGKYACKKRKLRDLLDVGEKVLVIAKHLKR